MKVLRLALTVALVAPAALVAQRNPTGRWIAVFTGPEGPRPQMVSSITFTLASTPAGLTGTARTLPEWPGVLDVSDVRVDGDRLSFVGTGHDGWTVNGVPHCCPRLVFDGTVNGDTMALTMTWTSTEQPDDPTARALPMKATRAQAQ